ncbi:MAG: L,D-transpeptidase [Flavobacteriales bacterium]|nr:L,D-transpeptidase [Flavobacteriales bacterium]
MIKRILLITFLFFALACFGQEQIIETAKNYIENKCNKSFDEVLFVSIAKQKMYHIKKNKIVKTFVISSSEYGTGSKAGSNKTPLGLHKVKQKYGEETPINGRMIGRVFYGEIATIYKDDSKSKTDDVTSRILWLEGLEKGKNKGEGIDSYKRYIYIHGTSEEGRLGKPASHGCIRMKNKAVIELFDKVKIGTLVLIL